MDSSGQARSIALVTGASGGIGRAVARRLGARFDLFLADVAEPRLREAADELRAEGMVVRGIEASDIGAVDAPRALVAAARAVGPLGAVVHAAGLSPSLADTDAILRVNLLSSELLLRALESSLEPGLVAVLIASIAGHTPLPQPVIDLIDGDPLDQDFAALVAQQLGGTLIPGLAYCVSKRWVARAPKRRIVAWARAGARIVSISPGMIDTTMGRAELDSTPGVQATVEMTPLGWGRPEDIAGAAAFLCSPDARFVTGCDLLVDGGVMPVMLAALGQ